MSYDPSKRSTGDLLRDWAAVMRELRKRDVIRTNNNPVGDIRASEGAPETRKHRHHTVDLPD